MVIAQILAIFDHRDCHQILQWQIGRHSGRCGGQSGLLQFGGDQRLGADRFNVLRSVLKGNAQPLNRISQAKLQGNRCFVVLRGEYKLFLQNSLHGITATFLDAC